jgi:hypothetical protein
MAHERKLPVAQARELLRSLGAPNVSIFVSDGLDEYRVHFVGGGQTGETVEVETVCAVTVVGCADATGSRLS